MRRLILSAAALLAGVVVASSPATRSGAAAFSWTGTWTTNQGTLKLTQTGSSLTGTFPGGGHVHGTASVTRAGGSWSGALETPLGNRVTGSGTFSFRAVGGDRFVGSWAGAAGHGGIWTGTRAGAPAPASGTTVSFSFSAQCGSTPCNNALYTAARTSGSGSITLASGGIGGGSGTAKGTATISLTGNKNAFGIDASNKTGSATITFTKAQSYKVASNGDKTLLLYTTVSGSGACASPTQGTVSISISQELSSLQVFACGNTLIWDPSRDPVTVKIG